MIPARSHPHSDSRHRLLVIDDDRKLCSLIADYLDPLGYDVTAIHTGPEGAARTVAAANQTGRGFAVTLACARTEVQPRSVESLPAWCLANASRSLRNSCETLRR